MKWITEVVTLVSLPLAALANDSWVPCNPTLPKGSKCLGLMAELRPTQPELGMREVKYKIKYYTKLKNKSAEAILAERIRKVAPVYIGPDNGYYLFDHHHSSRGFWEAGHDKVFINIIENWSDLEKGKPLEVRMKAFWSALQKTGKCYLKRQDGTVADPLSPEFPKNLKQMGNSRLRSLGWMLTEEKIIPESTVPFYEFYVAEFLFKNGLEVQEKGFKEALATAKKLLTKTPEGQKVITHINGPEFSPTAYAEYLQQLISKK